MAVKDDWGERMAMDDTNEILKWDRVSHNDLEREDGTFGVRKVGVIVSVHEHSVTVSYSWPHRIQGWFIRIGRAIMEL